MKQRSHLTNTGLSVMRVKQVCTASSAFSAEPEASSESYGEGAMTPEGKNTGSRRSKYNLLPRTLQSLGYYVTMTKRYG
jgi:hypothetical protein